MSRNRPISKKYMPAEKMQTRSSTDGVSAAEGGGAPLQRFTDRGAKRPPPMPVQTAKKVLTLITTINITIHN